VFINPLETNPVIPRKKMASPFYPLRFKTLLVVLIFIFDFYHVCIIILPPVLDYDSIHDRVGLDML